MPLDGRLAIDRRKPVARPVVSPDLPVVRQPKEPPPPRGRWPGSGYGPWLAAAAYVIIGVGMVLRLIQYLSGRSLWYDEAMLSLNIAGRSYGELLQPLDHNQVAPFGFLLAERLAVSLLGNTEYALRLLPLLAGCASLLLFWVVARRILAPVAALIALALFAGNHRLIYYASEVKQYSSDILIALLLFLLAFQILQEGATRRRLLVLGGVGAVGVWFSQPSVFIMAGLAAGLSFGALVGRNWGLLREQAITYALWAGSGIPAIVLARRSVSPETMEYQQDFWSGSFMPLPPTTRADLLWFVDSYRETLGYLVGFFTPLAGAIILVGCIWAFRHRRDVLLFLLVPALAALFASALHLYPVRTRLALFLLPSLLLLLGAGVACAGRWLAPRQLWIRGSLIAAVLALPLLTAAARLPMHREDIKPVLEYLVEHRGPGETLYVYYGAEKAFLYYADSFGLSQADSKIGVRAWGQPEVYRAELDGYRGRGVVWFLFSRIRSREGIDERQLFLDHLDQLGRRIDQFESKGAAVYLYHLP